MNFSCQIKPEILAALHALAHSEGRELESLVNEALTDLIEKYTPPKPRDEVMAAYRISREQYGALYKKLAE